VTCDCIRWRRDDDKRVLKSSDCHRLSSQCAIGGNRRVVAHRQKRRLQEPVTVSVSPLTLHDNDLPTHHQLLASRNLCRFYVFSPARFLRWCPRVVYGQAPFSVVPRRRCNRMFGRVLWPFRRAASQSIRSIRQTSDPISLLICRTYLLFVAGPSGLVLTCRTVLRKISVLSNPIDGSCMFIVKSVRYTASETNCAVPRSTQSSLFRRTV